MRREWVKRGVKNRKRRLEKVWTNKDRKIDRLENGGETEIEKERDIEIDWERETQRSQKKLSDQQAYIKI